MTWFASLPMYDLPEVRAATDTLWSALAVELRAAGIDGVPSTLDRTRPHEAQWADRGLLFGQSCGYPVTHRFAQALRVVATPVYAATGCRGAHYSSVIVVGDRSPIEDASELRGRVAAVNDLASYSGASALAAVVAPHARGDFFGDVRLSGGHVESLAMVARGAADVAAVDCVTYALLARHRPRALDGIRVIARSAEAAALPYVTRIEASDEVLASLRSALDRVMRTTDGSVVLAREALLLGGVEVLDDDAYRAGVAADHANREACGLVEP